MGDGYWRYGGSRLPESTAPPSAAPLKRTRADYGDIPGASELPGYYPRDEGRVGPYAIRETESINKSYDHYLHNGATSFGTGERARPMPAFTGVPVDDLRLRGPPGSAGYGGGSAGYGGGSVGYGGVRKEAPLPPDASNTLFVEGLPSDSTRREVSHIFRPFVGFREVRLVTKESRQRGGDQFVLCFVDFDNPSQAVTALDALQGYKIDEHEKESANLRLQFSRFPGPRSGGGAPRARR